MTRKIALLSDVHGNSTALEAVLADAESQQVTDYWFLGDLLLPGTGRRNILDRMEQLHISLQVRGNWEDSLWHALHQKLDLNRPSHLYLTRLPDDNPNSRRWDVLSKETLADVSLQSPDKTMADLPWPILVLHGALTDEFPDTAEAAAEGFPLLRDGSRLQQVRADDARAAQAEVARLAIEWITRRLR